MEPPAYVGYWLARTLRAVGAAHFEAMRAHCTERGKPYVVTPPQWGVLSTLADYGAQPISALGQLLSVETPAITTIITRLEQIGVVERVHDREDRRVVRACLTAEGRDIVESLHPLMAALNNQILPPNEAPAFMQQLHQLISRASALTPAKAGLVNLSLNMNPEEP